MADIPLPTDTSYILEDGATSYTASAYGQYGGSPRVFDCGSLVTRFDGLLVININAIDTSSGNELYVVNLIGATDAGFTTGVHYLAQTSPVATGQVIVPFFSVHSNIHRRYFKVQIVPVGTTPAITYQAFVLDQNALDALSTSQLTKTLGQFVNNWGEANVNFRNWLTGTATGGNGSGEYPLTDGNNTTQLLKSPTRMAKDFQELYAESTPAQFGAFGDGLSHKASTVYSTLSALQADYPFAESLNQEMDYLAIQKAIKNGRYIRSEKLHYVMYNNDGDPQRPLVFVSGENYADFNSSIFDMSALRPKTTTTHLNNYDFASASGWGNATIYGPGGIIPATFNTGKAVMTDIYTDGSNPFYQWGQFVDLPPGNYTLRVKIKATLGISYSNGNGNQPGWNASFFSNSPGDGGNPFGASIWANYTADTLPGTETEYTTTFRCNEQTETYLTFSGYGYANYEVTEFDITPVIMNCGIWMTRDGAGPHYPLPSSVGGFQLLGPGWDYPELAGIEYTSYEQMDGNHTHMHVCKVADWGDGMRFGNGAYLMEFTHFDIIGNLVGIHFQAGSTNAGENVRFYGGANTSNGVGIKNPKGGGITMICTAMDYFSAPGGDQTGTAIGDNSGRIDLVSCHMEVRPVKFDNLRIIHNTSGHVNFWGGVVLLSPGISLFPPFKNEYNTSSIRFHDTWIYNVTSEQGVWSDGAGVILGTWVAYENPFNSGIVSEAPVMDILGGAGSFEIMHVAEGSPFIGTTNEIGIDGGVWVAGGDKQQYGKWRNKYITGTLSTKHAYAGTRSLEIRKLDTPGNKTIQVVLLIPVKNQGQQVFTRGRLLFPGPQVYSSPPVIFGSFTDPDLTISIDASTVTLPSTYVAPTPVPEGTYLTPGVPSEATRQWVTTTTTSSDRFARTDVEITGKKYVEFIIRGLGLQDGGLRVGLTDRESLPYVNANGSIGYGSPVTVNGVNMGSPAVNSDYLYGYYGDRVNWQVNDVICMAVDADERVVKFRRNNGDWTPEFSISNLGSLLPCVGIRHEGESVEINGGAESFVFTPPLGYEGLEVQASGEVTGTGTHPLYRRTYFAKVVGRDKFDRPIFAEWGSFKGESTYNVPAAGDPTWLEYGPNTMYQNETTDPLLNKSMGAPAAATHFALEFGLVSLPTTSFYIDHLLANIF